MRDEVRSLLGAYHDGELDERQMARVEAHLAGCAECRRELAALVELGTLIADVEATPPGQAPERFVSQVMLSLPRPTAQPAWQPLLRAAWWSVPAVLLLGWAVLQTVLVTSGLVIAAIGTGVGSTELAALLPSGASLEGSVRSAAVPLAVLALALAVLVALGAITYWSWLASWQVRSQRLPH